MSNDLVEKADVVDHVVPLQFGGALFDLANLQSLCNNCHRDKSSLEGRGQVLGSAAVKASQEYLTVEDWDDEPEIALPSRLDLSR